MTPACKGKDLLRSNHTGATSADMLMVWGYGKEQLDSETGAVVSTMHIMSCMKMMLDTWPASTWTRVSSTVRLVIRKPGRNAANYSIEDPPPYYWPLLFAFKQVICVFS